MSANSRWLLLLAALVGISPASNAEPFFAVREGMDCTQCHINPTGGGARNPFGNVYAQTQLSAGTLSLPQPWTGQMGGLFNLGANARFGASQTDVSGADTNLDFATQRVTAYLGLEVAERLTLYLDQQVAPGGSLNREAWLKLNFDDFYLKAGKFFMPFGWRLEDNSAFVRQVSGINMLQGDDGVEFGWNNGAFNAQLAITNGNGGVADRDDGKQFTGRFAWVSRQLQLGFGLIDNNTDQLDRQGGGIFAGAKTGQIAWLFEYNRFEDDPEIGLTDEIDVALLEANWLIRKGHNLKLTLEHSETDLNSDDQQRYSAVYEFTPYPFIQLRLGYRDRESDAPSAIQNSDEAFVELHGFF